jgi:hypothetical protein
LLVPFTLFLLVISFYIIFRFTASDYLFGILKLIFPPSSRAIIPQSDELLPDKTIIPQSNELPPDKTIISQV